MNWGLIRALGLYVEYADVTCYLVGGAVRDDLAGSEPKDYDFVCDDSEKLIKLLKEAFPINVKEFKKYGTFQFKMLGEDVEFVNPRKEAYMTWSHKPTCTPGTIKDDIMRRDFTINTLAYKIFHSEYKGVDIVDMSGRGLVDFKAKRLDCVSDPLKTFMEDPSRLIRLCIYAAKGFNPTTETAAAAMSLAGEIKRVPYDAIKQMMDKGIVMNGFLRWMYNLGILQHIMPEFEDLDSYEQPQKHHIHNVWEHTVSAVEFLSPHFPVVRWAALFHDIGKKTVWDERCNYLGHEFESEKIARKILLKMRFSNKDMRTILHLVRNHMGPTRSAVHNTPTKRATGRFFRKHQDYLTDLFSLSIGDVRASGVHVESDLEKVREFYQKLTDLKINIGVLEEGKMVFKLDYSGIDIMNTLNIKPSPLVGEIKDILEKRICNGELVNKWREIDNYIRTELFVLKT